MMENRQSEANYLGHKIQALELLLTSRELTDSMKLVGATVLLRVINNATWEGFVTDKELAGMLDKSTKTISRAAKGLNQSGLFVLERGATNRATVWKISASFIKRILAHRKKPDKFVTRVRNDTRQSCPSNPSALSTDRGQVCPPILEERKKEGCWNCDNSLCPALEAVDVTSWGFKELCVVLRQEFAFVAKEECLMYEEKGKTFAMLPVSLPPRDLTVIWEYVVARQKCIAKNLQTSQHDGTNVECSDGVKRASDLGEGL